jgi:hypothetical protein
LHPKKKTPTTLPEETTTGQKQLPKAKKIDRAGSIKTSQKTEPTTELPAAHTT